MVKCLRGEGFSFVALTEHDRGLTPEEYATYVEQCRAHSSADFLVIPGIEVLCKEGIEVAVLGATGLIPHTEPAQVAEAAKQMGAFSIWVHPLKRKKWPTPVPADAIEIWNAKSDGTVAPNVAVIRKVQADADLLQQYWVTFGLDMHDLQNPRAVWLECNAAALDQAGILAALKAGAFRNRSARITLPSSGQIGWRQQASFALVRGLFVGWNRFWRIAPPAVTRPLQRLLAPIIRLMKGRP